jgi:NAD(P)-dependent dehydrogenase (short-subunit alcohol dehydrogenase family)
MGNEFFNLSGRRALVTGGSRGIGAAIAKSLAAAGADIIILARERKPLESTKAEIEKQTGRKVWTLSLDLAKLDKIEAAFERLISQIGGIDILVNCAGLTRRENAEDMDLKTWREVMDVNLTAVMILSQAFCRSRKKARKGGKIINIGSLMCRGGRPQTSAYAASKGGLLALTRALAVEWAKYNINVNAIGPGYIATELTAKLRADEDFNAWVISRTPMARWGSPEDLVGAAVFFAGSASDFITGQILYIDGGWVSAV